MDSSKNKAASEFLCKPRYEKTRQRTIQYSAKLLIARFCLNALIVAVCLSAVSCVSGDSAAGLKNKIVKVPKTEHRPVADGPILLRDDISLRKVVDVPPMGVRLVRNPTDGTLYYLNAATGLYKIEIGSAGESGTIVNVQAADAIVENATLAGLAFGPEGNAYAVANRKVGLSQTQAVILRGKASGKAFVWSVLATSYPYALSMAFDHTFNGVAVSPDGAWIYVNSGSRTDHGEVQSSKDAFPGMREVPLTSAIFKLPADAADLVLANNETALKPYLFADGTRNAYDPEFAPNGELFAGDNGPDADYPDEFNWLRSGRHYGFPWRFGNQDNPQQFAGYSPRDDMRLSIDFNAVRSGTYRNDPGFPKASAAFTDAIANGGPDAVQYRNDSGDSVDAAEDGTTLNSFTPHRSPLGLVFATDPALPKDLLPASGGDLSAFLLSWGSAGGSLSDTGRDLLHLRLTKKGDSYVMTSTQVARDFKNPIDAVLIGTKLYVLEWAKGGAVWELDFQRKAGKTAY